MLGGAPIAAIVQMPLQLAVGYWMVVPIYRVSLRILTAVLPGDALDELTMRVFNGLIGVAFALGDPLVCLLFRLKASWFPVDQYPIFAPTVTLYVLK